MENTSYSLIMLAQIRIANQQKKMPPAVGGIQNTGVKYIS